MNAFQILDKEEPFPEHSYMVVDEDNFDIANQWRKEQIDYDDSYDENFKPNEVLLLSRHFSDDSYFFWSNYH